MLRITAEQNHSRLPLHNFLRLHFDAPSVSRAFKLKAVRINGKKADRDVELTAGDVVTIHCSMANDSIEILYENEFIVAVNKPAGLVSQQNSETSYEKSLEGRVCRQTGQNLILVHRLDKETSGCILFAKSSQVFNDFKNIFAGKKITKIYWAVVTGLFSKKISSYTNLLENSRGQKESAITHFEVCSENPEKQVSFVKVQIETGRHHQIRRHFSMNGHGLLGDGEWGDFKSNKMFQAEYGLKRQFLHAYELKFELYNNLYEIKAALPPELSALAAKLGLSFSDK